MSLTLFSTHPTPPIGTVHPAPQLRVSATRLDTATLLDIVGGLARAEDLWRPHVVHDTGDRARVRLLATAAYEVWLLGWSPSQSVGLHDHGGANAAFVVLDGTLTETVAAEPNRRASTALVRHVLAAGDAVTVEAGQVHDVANASESLATSLHVYSKPLRSMGFYETARPAVRGHRVRTLWIDDVPPVVNGDDGGPPDAGANIATVPRSDSH